MDNEKIGKFIAKLRKAKNLTQQQLGDMVGVGGKSVSKWERGLNMPDISIINQVSKVLDITSDELLKGEFDRKSTNEEYIKKKNRMKNAIRLLIVILFTGLIVIMTFFYFKNDTHKYWISSATDGFEVDGVIEYDKNGYSINIENIYCRLEECTNNNINSIKYKVTFNNTLVYKNDMENLEYKTINEHLAGKVIYVNAKYMESIMSYNDMKNNNMDIIIYMEMKNINDKVMDYQINLRIDDKQD